MVEEDGKRRALTSLNGADHPNNATAANARLQPASSGGQVRRPRTLQGKVALIVGGTSENGRSLAVGLAERGSDVAIIYFNGAHEVAKEIKQEVEAWGQRCLTISSESGDEQLSAQLVQQVVATFGQLDVFISFSASLSTLDHVVKEEPDESGESLRASFFPDLYVMKAALNQMIES